MKIWSEAFHHGNAIPTEYAFGKAEDPGPMGLSSNRSPPLSWEGVPEGTKSLVLLCHDPDVPSRPDDVNQAGRKVPADLPRIEFFHWVLMDIAPSTTSLPAGIGSEGITARGKPGPEAAEGRRHGVNDYGAWFAGDAEMNGDYYGYDGPCPPWNDTILHHYWFTLYALDVERCPLEGKVTGQQVREAIAAHVIGKASTMGTYSIARDVVEK